MAEGVAGLEAVFSRAVSLGDFAEALTGRIEATAQERGELAALFGIESLESFTFDYTLEPVGTDRAHLSGEIHAELTQLCILTLEPVRETVDETVSLACWPQKQIEREEAAAPQTDPQGLPADPPAPIVNGRINVGALAAEILASAINPYPRKDGVEFAWDDPRHEDGAAFGPFAELAKLKSKR
jgi:hypothetical protein